MRGERPAWCSQEHGGIVGAHQCANGDETVSAGTILDDDRLAPAPAQSISDHSRADIDPAARSERHDELDRALRPGLRRRWLCRQDKHGETGDAKCKTLHAQQWYLRCHDPRVQASTTRKQRCPAGVCITFHLMNDNTLALTTLRGASGKSTLFKLIGGLAAPSTGTIDWQHSTTTRTGRRDNRSASYSWGRRCFLGAPLQAASIGR